MTRQIAYQYPEAFKKLLDEITEATIAFLLAQIEAGAEVVKVFDSHAGLLGEDHFKSFVIDPMIKIVEAIKKSYPTLPIIGFPRKAGLLYENFALQTKADCIAIDHCLPFSWIKEKLQKLCVVQGNLDNIYLNLDLNDAREVITDAVREIIKNLHTQFPAHFIFNLSHGCLPTTKIENIEFIINEIRKKN